MKSKCKHYIALTILFFCIFTNINLSIYPSINKVYAVTKVNSLYEEKVNSEIDKISNILLSKDVKELSDWEAMGLCIANKEISNGYLEKIEKEIRENFKDRFRRTTDYERTIMAITAAGGDPTNIAGKDLVSDLCNIDWDSEYDILPEVFALIAIDCGEFQLVQDSKLSKDAIIESIIEKKDKNIGGWGVTDVINPDVTAMVIAGLSKYYENDKEVKNTIDNAIIALSKTLNENGEFISDSEQTSSSSESISQTIIALCSMGIDPIGSKEFIRNDKNLIDLLLEFKTKDGGFSHQKNGDMDKMATEQAFLAMLSYKKFINGKEGSIYLFKNNSNKIPVQNISFQQNEIMLKEGEEYVLKASVTPENASNKNIEWTSDNEDIAKVDMKGNITGVSEGTTVITAITKDGNKMAKCKIKVVNNKKNIMEIVNSTPNSELKLGNKAEIQVKAINNSQEDKNFILIVALYNEEDNKMISYDLIEGMINGGEFENFKTKIEIPTDGKYNIKVFAWDDIENMNSLSNRIDMKIK